MNSLFAIFLVCCSDISIWPIYEFKNLKSALLLMSTHDSHTSSIDTCPFKSVELKLSWVSQITLCNFLGQTLNTNFVPNRAFRFTFIQLLTEKGKKSRGWMGLDWIVLEAEEFSSFFSQRGGLGGDMALISALMGVGVGLTFWDKLRFINAPVDIKPRSSD